MNADMDELIAQRATAREMRPEKLARHIGFRTWPTTACAACSTDRRPRSRNSAAWSTSPTGCEGSLTWPCSSTRR